jgi:serine/threonine protein kinase
MKVLKKAVVAAKGQVEHTKSERSILCEIRHPFVVRCAVPEQVEVFGVWHQIPKSFFACNEDYSDTISLVCRLRFAFQSEDKLYLVTDYYNGGSLFYHLRKSRNFSEDRAKYYAAGKPRLALRHTRS